jgi:hypothetical protein
MASIARHFGIDERTFQGWVKAGEEVTMTTSPGKPGEQKCALAEPKVPAYPCAPMSMPKWIGMDE